MACQPDKTPSTDTQNSELETQNSKLEPSNPQTLEPPYYRFLTGRLGMDLNVAMHLHVWNDSTIDANYSYQRVGRPIRLKMHDYNAETGRVEFWEYDPDMPYEPEITGRFIGNFFDDDLIRGSWSTFDESAVYETLLNDAKPEGSAGIEFSLFDSTSYTCQNLEFCPYIELVEMKISNVASSVGQIINQKIKKEYGDFIFSKPSTHLQLNLRTRIDSLSDFLSKNREGKNKKFLKGWMFIAKPIIFFNQQDILSFKIDFYSHQGGMTGLYKSSCHTFDLQTGEEINLSKFFKLGYEDALRTNCLQRLKLTYGDNLNEDLRSLGFNISDKDFKITTNFYYSLAGLNFIYNRYEIAPPQMGEIEVFIPWKAVEQLRKF